MPQRFAKRSEFGHRTLTPQASVSDFDVPDAIRDSLYADPTTMASIPVFNSEGTINMDVKGVSTLSFQKLAWYHTVISMSWPKMILLSLAVYLAVVGVFSVAYYVMCKVCGASVTSVGALYFVVVSLSANGGYMGEDVNVLYPGHKCFTQRTYLVMAASFVSILLGALIATVFIAKASTQNKLRHRVVFSDYITLNATAADTFRMTFRVASISDRPMVHGKLRLYLASMTHDPQHHKHRREAARRRASLKRSTLSANSSFRRRASVYLDVLPPTSSREASRRAAASVERGGQQGATATDVTIEIPSADVEYDPTSSTALASHRIGRHTTSSYGTMPEEQRATPATGPQTASTSDANPAAADGPSIGVAKYAAEWIMASQSDDVLNAAGDVLNSSMPNASTYVDAYDDQPAAMESSGLQRTSSLYQGSSSVGNAATAFMSADADGGGGDVGDGAYLPPMDDSELHDDEFPLHMRLEELPWSCDEEIPLPGGQGDLNLWFPSTIHHVIDSDSPLYYIITGQRRPTEAGLYHRGHRHFHHQRSGPVSADPAGVTSELPSAGDATDRSAAPAAAASFQVVAVFEATDAATSTIVESKHVYTPDTLIAHYHFACPTLLVQRSLPEGVAQNHMGIAVGARETCIDFFRFNELVPDDVLMDDDYNDSF